MIYGIILAAGSGKRMKTKEKKQFLKLSGKPILYHSIDKFLKIKLISKIIIVINPKDNNNQSFKDLLSIYNKEISDGKISFVFGGKERYNSVYNALRFLYEFQCIKNKDKVLIHDSARPNVNINDIKKLINCLNKYKAISLSYKLADSIKKIKSINKNVKLVLNSIDRDSHYLIATPQAFEFSTLFNSYNKFMNSSKNIKITDDLQVVENFSNSKVYLLDSSSLNLKITTKSDLDFLNISRQ